MLDTLIAAVVTIVVLALHGLAMLWVWRRRKRSDGPGMDDGSA